MKYRFISISIIALFTFLILFATCAQLTTEWKGTIEEVDGVKIVKNPKEPIYGTDIYLIEEELIIGGEQGSEENIFYHMSDIEVDDSGNIYILDMRVPHIKVFSSRGDYLRTIGKKGQGPGELSFARSFHINEQDELIVPDSGNGRINFFSLHGELLRSTNIEMNISLAGLSPKIDSQGNYYALVTFYDKPLIELQKFASGLEYLSTITSFPRFISEGNVITTYPPIPVFTIASDDSILCGYGDNYEIEIFNPRGRLTKRIVRQSDRVKISDAVIRAETEAAERKGGILSGYEIKFPKYYPFFVTLASDEESRIYVQTYEQIGDMLGYDVFCPDGRYLTWVPIQGFIEEIKEDKIYTIEWREDGYQYLHCYKVTWDF
jgi:hypothetical protein